MDAVVVHAGLVFDYGGDAYCVHGKGVDFYASAELQTINEYEELAVGSAMGGDFYCCGEAHQMFPVKAFSAGLFPAVIAAAAVWFYVGVCSDG